MALQGLVGVPGYALLFGLDYFSISGCYSRCYKCYRHLCAVFHPVGLCTL